MLIRELLFADDECLSSHSEAGLQRLVETKAVSRLRRTWPYHQKTSLLKLRGLGPKLNEQLPCFAKIVDLAISVLPAMASASFVVETILLEIALTNTILRT